MPYVRAMSAAFLIALLLLLGLAHEATAASATPSPSPPPPDPNYVTPECGPQAGGALCGEGFCCSASGFCGNTAPYCALSGCLMAYGYCWTTVSPSFTPGYSWSATVSPSFSPSPATATPSPKYSGTVSTVCGNGVCEQAWLDQGENCGNCPVDCSSCQILADAFGCSSPGIYALTYDDGPMVGPTNNLLSILAADKLTAAFFLIGSHIDALGAGYLLAAEEAAGHTTYSHTYTHPYLSTLTPEAVYNEMYLTELSFQVRCGADGGGCVRVFERE